MKQIKELLLTFLFFSLFFSGQFMTYQLYSGWAEKTLASLSIDEKIGQLIFVGVRSNPEMTDDPLFKNLFGAFDLHEKHDEEYAQRMLEQYHVGGILYICNGDPLMQHNLTRRLQQKSGLPLLFVQDFEWGLSMRLKDVVRFPKNMTLGALQNDELINHMGKEIARQSKLLGIHVNFAPVVDVNNNPANPVINDRSFGQNPEKVAAKAIAMFKGLQDGGILACAKHFPGHGDVTVDSHANLPIIPHDLERLKKVELYPFKQVIDSGIAAVMTAHLEIPALESSKIPVSLSPKVVTNLLKENLGFRGLTFSDGLVMKGVTNSCSGDGDVELKSLLAGNDVLLFPKDVYLVVKKIKQALTQGVLSYEALDVSVLKILRAKEQLGLHENRVPFQLDTLANLNTTEALQLKKELFSQAVTLVKGEKDLPLSIGNNSRIALVQVGIEECSPFSRKLQKIIPHMLVTLLSDQDLKEKLKSYETILLAFFGMNKFAKQDFGISKDARALVDSLNQDNKKIIITLFGSPYALKFFGKESVIIEAYEDDPDAQEAAAEIILGKRTAIGKLPVSF